MASRPTIARLAARIEELAERVGLVDHRPLLVVPALGEDAKLIAAAMDPTGRRPVYVIRTGVPQTPDPARCSAASVAAALPQVWEMIARQREIAARDTCGNGFAAFADRLERQWRGLCERFGLDYEAAG